jgi:hypothetical protein
MRDYIDKATEFINPNSPLILSKNSIYLRNRIIDKATSLWADDPTNYPTLYKWFSKDIIRSQERADHFGKAIGSHTGKYITSPIDQDYYNRLAKVKKEIRSLAKVSTN